jgi:hypothetical protein
MRTLESEWQKFYETFVPIDATKYQIEQIKRVFYLGAYASVRAIVHNAVDGTPERDSIAQIHDEFKAFMDEPNTEIFRGN